MNLEKDLKIEQLTTKQRENNPKNISLFDNYQHIFSSAELTTLRSIPFTTAKDSTFILQTLRLLYKDNLSALNNRTASCKTKDKNPISPKKKK